MLVEGLDWIGYSGAFHIDYCWWIWWMNNMVGALDEGRQEFGPGIVLSACVSSTHAYPVN
uniref:Uncharacterized protein n=1 Tax=Romanomermis culicivorax TaxID=13658 RepID=A0A915HS04_ROMCU